MVVIRYLPGDVDMSTVSGGLGACIVDTYFFDGSLISGSVIAPLLPQPSSGGVGAFGATPALPVPPTGRISLGPPPGSTCPPGPGVPLGPDVNGDGVSDWHYPGDKRIPGTNLVTGVYGINVPHPAFRCGIGGGGKLDPNEIWSWIGECPWLHGVNWSWSDPPYRYFHWKSDDAPVNDNLRIRHYIYDLQTGILKVYGDGGQLLYQGPPSGWHWYP
jgi:hypothetical protein